MGLTWNPFKPDAPAEENAMVTGKQRTWWQEMGAISRGMMFLDGSLVTPAALPPEGQRHHQVAPNPGDAPPVSTTLQDRLHWLLEDLVLLGGRPATLPHHDDINEPLPLLHRRRSRNPRSTQACATC